MLNTVPLALSNSFFLRMLLKIFFSALLILTCTYMCAMCVDRARTHSLTHDY